MSPTTSNSVTSTVRADLLEEPRHLALAAEAAPPRDRRAGRLGGPVDVVGELGEDAVDVASPVGGVQPLDGCRSLGSGRGRCVCGCSCHPRWTHRSPPPHGGNTPSSVAPCGPRSRRSRSERCSRSRRTTRSRSRPGRSCGPRCWASISPAPADLGPEERATTWWTSALRFLGCTGHAFDMAVVFGDEIEMRAESMQADFANPFDMMRLMVTHAGPGTSGVHRMRSVLAGAGGREEGGRDELPLPPARSPTCSPSVSISTRTSGPRWRRASNAGTGAGLPTGAKADRHPAADAHRPARARSSKCWPVSRASTAPSTSFDDDAGKAYDPDADRPRHSPTAREWWAEVEPRDPWDAALEVAPRGAPLSDDAVHEALLVLADFSDLKSPWLGGHSRAVAALGARGVRARRRGWPRSYTISDGWRSRTRCGTSRAGLTRDERDRAEPHTLVTDQLLRRLPYTAALADVACGAHERMDGSGYHRRVESRAPRRRATRARRRRLLSGDDVGSSAPRRAARATRPRPSCAR